LHVFFAHQTTPEEQARAGFEEPFSWDVDLLCGYPHTFLRNVSARPGTDCFDGCNTPELAVRLRDGGFEAVLVMGWYLRSFVQASWAARRLGLRILVRGDSHLETPRSMPKTLAKELVYPVALRAFDAILYVGQKSKEYYRHFRVPAERLFFSPHCVDNDWFRSRATPEAGIALRAKCDIPSDAKVVLFAGKLIPLKRPLDIVQAVVKLRQSSVNAHVLIAGSGALETEIAGRAHSLEVPVHFLGFQNQSQMPAAYAASDALVLPSVRETWGLVANEALACGKPIVVSDAVGCAPDLAGDGSAGQVFPTTDCVALAAAMYHVLSDPPSVRAIHRKSTAFSTEAAAAGVEKALAFATRNSP
jgi:glycosyltransferase involved in cell wall biosynthesis